MEAHETIVNVVVAANSSDETARTTTCLSFRRLSRRAMPRGHE
jgi:hypothetical protein